MLMHGREGQELSIVVYVEHYSSNTYLTRRLLARSVFTHSQLRKVGGLTQRSSRKVE